MPLNFKSYSVTGRDDGEQEFSDANGALPLGKGDNMVYKILHSFIKQGNNRFINIATNAVRRATNHRYSFHLSLFAFFLSCCGYGLISSLSPKYISDQHFVFLVFNKNYHLK